MSRRGRWSTVFHSLVEYLLYQYERGFADLKSWAYAVDKIGKWVPSSRLLFVQAASVHPERSNLCSIDGCLLDWISDCVTIYYHNKSCFVILY